MSRRIRDLDVEVSRETGQVWARTEPGSGWWLLGAVVKTEDGEAWASESSAPMGRKMEWVLQRQAVAFVVDEAIAGRLVRPVSKAA